MQLMTKTDKQQVTGGIAPMLLWVIIMGAYMAVNATTNGIASIMNAKHNNNASDTHKKNGRYYASQHRSGYLRMSAFPSRSAMSMPM